MGLTVEGGMAERHWTQGWPLRVPQWSVLMCVGVKERHHIQRLLQGCVQWGPGVTGHRSWGYRDKDDQSSTLQDLTV